MDNITPEELQTQGSTMATSLHRMLSDALARIASLEGDKAILEMRLRSAQKPPESNPNVA